MKRLFIALVLLSFGFVFSADPAEGIWKSISDVKGEEGKVTAFWKIEVVNDTLQGIILHVPDQDDAKLYDCKKKEFDKKPIVGYPWLFGLKKKADGVWVNGKIVDVGNDKGDVYGCDIKVLDNGKILNMKGYLNILGAKIGREQNWQRSSEEELNAAREKTRAKLGK